MSYINTINNADTNYLIAGVSNIIICSTSASTVAKTATAMDGFSLDSNLSFKIIFTNGNTASSPTLNLNSIGAKSLTTTTSNYTLVKNMLYDCYYNGSSYVLDNTVTVHTANTSNPHSVTKAQVGLGNCDNTADANKVVKSATTATTATTATSASKLTTARKTYVTLGTASTTTKRDWSGDTTIPVSGTLPIANGGTSATTYSNARSNLKAIGFPNWSSRTTLSTSAEDGLQVRAPSDGYIWIDYTCGRDEKGIYINGTYYRMSANDSDTNGHCVLLPVASGTTIRFSGGVSSRTVHIIPFI